MSFDIRWELALKTVKPTWLLDSAKDTSPFWDSANQSPLRILGRLSWNICHRRWSLRGKQRLLGSCYHEARTWRSAWASACWSFWRRSLRPRTTHSHRARWIRSVNSIQRYCISWIFVEFDFQICRLSYYFERAPEIEAGIVVREIIPVRSSRIHHFYFLKLYHEFKIFQIHI